LEFRVAKQLKSPPPPTQEGNAEYEQLEKILQKHEADIRFHIRVSDLFRLRVFDELFLKKCANLKVSLFWIVFVVEKVQLNHETVPGESAAEA